MEDLVHKYLQIRIIQWINYPQGDPMESLKAVCKDDFLGAIELRGYGYKNEETKRLLRQSHLKVYYGIQPRLLGGRLNPDDLDEENRKRAEATLIEAAGKAGYLGAKGTTFLAGKRQPETKEQAYMQLLETARTVYGYFAEKGMMVELEMFDYGTDKAALAGLTPYTAEFAASMYATHNNFGLLVDLSRFPIIYETSRFVIRTLRSCITHSHFGNVVVVRDCDGYGDLHPKFRHPNSANDTPQLLDYLKVMKEEGFFDAKNPYVLSMEMALYPGEDENTVLANTKRTLKWAWALPEDSA